MKELTRDYSARKEGHRLYLQRLQDPKEIAKRFWAKVDRRSPDECWPWTGSTINGGYGMFRFRNKNWPAHRVAYVLLYGDFDFALDVCHHCDNPPCCNGDHLFLGTAKDNIWDAIQKGRWINPEPRHGEQNPRHALTEKDVRAIRQLHKSGTMSQRAIALEYGVNYRTINVIVLGINWRHI